MPPNGHRRPSPINLKPYRTTLKSRECIRQKIAEMKNNGVIVESKSPWAFGVVIVPKKNGDTRFCVDYRKLNAITRRDVYPLPAIDRLLDSLGGARYLSTLD